MRNETNEEIRKAYFLSLCVEVGTDQEKHECYAFMWHLHKKPFSWFVPNDDNRAEDGKHLREIFADNMLGEDCPCLDGPCSVLEMLVALAIRMEDILHVPNEPSKVDVWFWEFIDNLELDVFKDRDRYQDEKALANSRKLDMFMSRTYHPDGRGGLFPLKRPETDQRNVEIWYQMMSYLNENYPL